jgi:hypothetical protein
MARTEEGAVDSPAQQNLEVRTTSGTNTIAIGFMTKIRILFKLSGIPPTTVFR